MEIITQSLRSAAALSIMTTPRRLLMKVLRKKTVDTLKTSMRVKLHHEHLGFMEFNIQCIRHTYRVHLSTIKPILLSSTPQQSLLRWI
jgi:hypothetical protein